MGKFYKFEIDVWALGCFAYELATGSPPFATITIRSNLLDAIVNQEIERIPAKWSDSFADFVSKCFIKDQQERWSIE